MNKRLYVGFTFVQTVPPSCINRDDTGSPKTAIYGGVTRRESLLTGVEARHAAAFAEKACWTKRMGKRH